LSGKTDKYNAYKQLHNMMAFKQDMSCMSARISTCVHAPT